MNSQMRTAVSGQYLVSTAVAAILLGLPLAAVAQQQQPTDDLQEVTVTGSRVIREGMSSPTPVTSLSSDELLHANPQSVAQALAYCLPWARPRRRSPSAAARPSVRAAS